MTERYNMASILLVDDCSAVRQITCVLLRANGFDYDRSPNPYFDPAESENLVALRKGNVRVFLTPLYVKGEEIIKNESDLTAVFLDRNLGHMNFTGLKLGHQALDRVDPVAVYTISDELGEIDQTMYDQLKTRISQSGKDVPIINLRKNTDAIVKHICDITDQYNAGISGKMGQDNRGLRAKAG